MLIGAHVVIQSTNPAADRAFLSDMMKLSKVDAGGGYVIHGLPPSEVSVHLGREFERQALYLMCDDVVAFMTEMKNRDVECEPMKDEGWGLLTFFTLPGGQKLGVYEPRHPHPPAMAARRGRKRARKGSDGNGARVPRKQRAVRQS
jgi:hypothetical protein